MVLAGIVGAPPACDEADDAGRANERARVLGGASEHRFFGLHGRPGAKRRRTDFGVRTVEEAIGYRHEVDASRLREDVEGAEDHVARRVIEDERGHEPRAAFLIEHD